MDRVSSELHKNQRAPHSKLESAKAPEKAKDTFRHETYETLAEYAERRLKNEQTTEQEDVQKDMGRKSTTDGVGKT